METCDAGRGMIDWRTDEDASPTMDELMARLSELTARLDVQTAQLAAMDAQSSAQARRLAQLEATPLRAEAPAATVGAEPKVGRRGLLRKVLGATAVAAVLTVAKEAAPAEAIVNAGIYKPGTEVYALAAGAWPTGDPDTDMPDLGAHTRYGIIGYVDGSLGRTFGSTPAPDSAGIYGWSYLNSGLLGVSEKSFGVFGRSSSALSFGVKGIAGSEGIYPNTTAGVWGSAINTNGVIGTSNNYSGVIGIAGGVGPGLGAPFGVVGTSISSIGVLGSSTNNTGVRGESSGGIGVYGESTNSYGCGGATSKPGMAGLFGYAGVASAAGFLGVNGAPGGTAGYFHGNVTVDGGFQVVNGPKNALVAHPDGSLRKMYCQESPEPWFEDFGTAQLQGGKTTVRLDPDFAAVVKADQYSVFPIPEGACEGLYIAAKTPTGFEVRELRGGTSSVPFSYRLVARRKDDVGRRMEKVDLPKFDLRPPGPPPNPPGQDKRPPR